MKGAAIPRSWTHCVRAIWIACAAPPAAALATLALAALAAGLAPVPASAQQRLQAGVLACEGEGGWSAIIASRKTFSCTFSADDGAVREQYYAAINRFGLDLGLTGRTALTWLVFGPAERVGAHYQVGALTGAYGGIGADAALGVGLGANVLVGGSEDNFALQPVSVQVQTGISIAAGVRRMELQFFDVIE